MKKGLLILTALVCACLFVTSGILTAADFPEEIVFDGKDYKKDIKPPVKFAHMKHASDYGIECSECHHDYQNGENVWEAGDDVKHCSECHDPNKNNDKAKKLMMAFHNNCKNCHKEKGEPAPTKCEGCHIEAAK